MSQCVVLNADGTLVPTTDAPQQCAGYVLLTPGEYAASQWSSALWATPTADQIGTAVQYGFFLPLMVYVLASWTGVLANFFKSNHS